MSSHPIITHTTVSIEERVRTFLFMQQSVVPPFGIKYQGVFKGQYYKNVFLLQDLDMFFAYERTDPVQDSDTFKLDKPLCIMHTQFVLPEEGSVDTGVLQLELQLVVNYEPQGLLSVSGYSSLLQDLLNPTTRKSQWLQYGLAPRRVQQGSLHNGSELSPKLKDRLLIKSIIATLTTIGAD
jgi:hypothetical protein